VVAADERRERPAEGLFGLSPRTLWRIRGSTPERAPRFFSRRELWSPTVDQKQESRPQRHLVRLPADGFARGAMVALTTGAPQSFRPGRGVGAPTAKRIFRVIPGPPGCREIAAAEQRRAAGARAGVGWALGARGGEQRRWVGGKNLLNGAVRLFFNGPRGERVVRSFGRSGCERHRRRVARGGRRGPLRATQTTKFNRTPRAAGSTNQSGRICGWSRWVASKQGGPRGLTPGGTTGTTRIRSGFSRQPQDFDVRLRPQQAQGRSETLWGTKPPMCG